MFAPESLSNIRPRDFTAPLTRRLNAMPVVWRRKRRHKGRRLVLLGAAVALPAMAMPGAMDLEAEEIHYTQAVEAPTSLEIAAPAPVDLDQSAGIAPNAEPAATQPAFIADALHVSGAFDRERAQHCMAMALYYEANTEGESGQRAVAQVILNRVAHRHYPDSVCGVVFQGSHRETGCQFSFTCDGSMDRHEPNQRSWRRVSSVAREALAGSVFEPVGLATHYHTTRINPYWAPRLHRIATVGKHRFYRKPGRSGRPAAYSFAYQGGEPLVAAYANQQAEAPMEQPMEQVAPAIAPAETESSSPPSAFELAFAQELSPQEGPVRDELPISGEALDKS